MSQQNLSNGSDEDDYMSDKILNQIEDKRPGLVFNRETARRYEIEKKSDLKNKQNRQLPVKELEELKRKEALETSSLKPDNKGFNLMLKMGYKSGETLGKSSSESKQKLLEPIPIEIKTDREGLGQSAVRKQKLDEIELLREKIKSKKRHQEENTEQSYLKFKRTKFNLRKLRYNLHKCQRICYQLDSLKNLKKPEILWYWPLNVILDLQQKDKDYIEPVKIESNICTETVNVYTKSELAESSNIDYKEKILDRANINLKEMYEKRLDIFLQTDNSSEFKEEKIERDDDDDEFFEDKEYNEQVRIEKARNEGEDMSDIDESGKDDEEDEELMIKKIDSICLYLREKYLYCVWCASTFNDEQDMVYNCPGLGEKDHEDQD